MGLLDPKPVTKASMEANLPTRLSDTSLAAAYAKFARPSTIPATQALAKVFDPSTSAYNVAPAPLAKTRAAMAKARAGMGRIEICALGTSLVAGTGAGTKALSWPAQWYDRLVARGYPSGGSGFIAAQSNNSATTDARVTLGAGWSAFDAFKTHLVKGENPAGNLTFADDKPSTEIVIHYQDYGTFAWAYSIDGAADVVVNNVNATTLKKITITGLASANHTLVIKPTGASVGAPLYVLGAQFKKSTGVVIHNIGLGGIEALDAFDEAGANRPIGVAKAINPNLTILHIGANEGSTDTPFFKARMQTGITVMKGLGGDVAILGELPTGASVTDRNIPDVLKIDYELADENNLALVDLSAAFINWATADAAGLTFADTPVDFDVHYNQAGYAQLASVVDDGLHL